MVKLRLGLTSWLMSLNDLFLVHFFLIYINDQSDDLFSNSKSFADNTSLFTVGCEESLTPKDLNNDLQKLRNRVYQ